MKRTLVLTGLVISVQNQDGSWAEVDDLGYDPYEGKQVIQYKVPEPEPMERLTKRKLRPRDTHPRSPTRAQANPRKGRR